MALHYCLAQFHGTSEIMPGNLPERLFAVITLVFGMLMFSAIVSIITGTFFNIRQSYRENNEFMNRLSEYLKRHDISPDLKLIVKRHVENSRAWCRDVVYEKELLEPLPKHVRKSLLVEVR